MEILYAVSYKIIKLVITIFTLFQLIALLECTQVFLSQPHSACHVGEEHMEQL